MKNNILLKSVANTLLAFSMFIFSSGLFASELIRHQEVNHSFTYISGENISELPLNSFGNAPGAPANSLLEDESYLYYVDDGNIIREDKKGLLPPIVILAYGYDSNIELYEVNGDYIYYVFSDPVFNYIQEVPHKNWNITNPTVGFYDINLSNLQVVIDKNFGNMK